MSTVLLIVQLIISIILTGLILIQQSEGGALGIGGGGGGAGSFMSGRSAASSVGRMTSILGTLFILNCLALSIVFNKENQNISLIDDTQAVAPLTSTSDSVDETIPLADDNASEMPLLNTETGALETPSDSAVQTPAEEPATETTEDTPEDE